MSMPMTIAEAAKALDSGQLSAAELTEAMLGRVAALDAELGAFVTVTADEARAAAATADAERARGLHRGPLHGIPLVVKDIIATADAPTTANSRVPARTGVPAGVDAPVVARLRAAGAVILGKTTTSEYAIGKPDPQTGFAMPRNPWNLNRSAAGSSAGTGIAVAAGLALGGLGTDTGGSVRGPAAFNGHTGLKVSFGRVPKSGVVPLGQSLDSVGPMARSAEDCALILQAIAGADPSDVTTLDVAKPKVSLPSSLTGVRIAVPRTYFLTDPGVSTDTLRAFESALEVLRSLGATTVEIDVPWSREAKEAQPMIARSEAFAFHHDDLVARWDDYGRWTRPLLAQGVLYSAGDLARLSQFRAAFCRRVAEIFDQVDLIATPTCPTGATPLSAADSIATRRAAPGFMGQWNLTGSPALALPMGFDADHLPLSLQLVGRPYDDEGVLAAGHAFQQSTDWHLQVPPIARLEAREEALA